MERSEEDGKIRTGIIGCGKGAHLHAQALKSVPQSEFVGVYSRSPETAKAFAEQYGVKAYASIAEMAAAGIEAVVICTRTRPRRRGSAGL